MHAVVLAAFALCALVAQTAEAPAGRVVKLALPHPVRAGESALLEAEVGVIERGAEIEISTLDGRSLGVISPFGVRSSNPVGTYTVPLPADVIANNSVVLRVSLRHYGHTRAPTAKEVKSIRVKIMPASP